MSQAAAREYINSVIKSSKEWRGITNIRAAMNTMSIHSLNLSYSIFKENNKYTQYPFTDEQLRAFHSALIQALHSIVHPDYIFPHTEAAKKFITRQELLKADKDKKCILISNPTTLKLIGYDYRAIRRVLTLASKSNSFIDTSPLGRRLRTSKVLPENIDPETGEILEVTALDRRLVSRMHLGHTGEITPLVEKIKTIISEVTELTGNTNDPLVQELSVLLNKAANNQRFLKYSHINMANNNRLGGAVIELVVQPEDLNLAISDAEAELERNLVTSIQKYASVLDIPGSNTLRQDIIQFVSDRVLEGLTGIPQKNIKPHTPAKGSLKTPAKASPKPAKSYKDPRRPQLRTVRGQFYSLASLQRLLDANLTQKIKENMGDGTRRDVLNLRSGRFAESARVERLSESREGMITAFYTYMKNPYQTFEPEFKQGSPSSRNPRLLISKSIREIAATQVANRMRAVLV